MFFNVDALIWYHCRFLSFAALHSSLLNTVFVPYSLYQPFMTMGGPLQPQPMLLLQPGQQGMASQGAGAKASLPSTWSDPSVNISLDFLGPGMHPPKQSQPSLLSLQHGERNDESDTNGDRVKTHSNHMWFKAFGTSDNLVCSVVSR